MRLFEEVVERSGPDFTLDVEHEETCKRIAHAIASANALTDQKASGHEVRFRIDMLDGTRVVRSVYLTRFGRVSDGKVWMQLEEDPFWLGKNLEKLEWLFYPN